LDLSAALVASVRDRCVIVELNAGLSAEGMMTSRSTIKHIPSQSGTRQNISTVFRVSFASAREMLKHFVQSGKSGSSKAFESGALTIAIVGVCGLAFLIAEGAVLSAQGIRGAAVVLTAVFVAATLSSIAGFAFSALCGALLFHFMDSPVYAVNVMIVCSIAIQLLSVATLWHSIDWRSLPIFLSGGIVGVPAGVYLLLHLQTGAYRIVIGVLLIAYGGYLLLRWPARSLRTRPLSDACAGFLGGLTGGLAGFPGAFVTIWCGMKGWDKARQRGVYQPFILSMQPVTLIAIHLMRPSSSTATQLDWETLAFIPAAVLGAWFGLRIFKRLTDRQFEGVVNTLLILSGVGLIL
jgi:uncharacterized protein